MHIRATPLRCLDCAHEWARETVENAPFDVVIAVMRAVYCPACGADSRRVVMVGREKAWR